MVNIYWRKTNLKDDTIWTWLCCKWSLLITNDLDTLLSEKNKFHLIKKLNAKFSDVLHWNYFWLDKTLAHNIELVDVNFDFTASVKFLLKYQRLYHIHQKVITNQLTYKCRYGHNTYENEIHKTNCKERAEVLLLRLYFFITILQILLKCWYTSIIPTYKIASQ